MKDFRSLRVWKQAHELTLRTYEETSCYPKEELFGLTNQMRRASSSIAANLAEGCGRKSDAELSRFAGIAFGSANELEYFLLLSADLGYIEAEVHRDLQDKVVTVKRMLAGLLRTLSQNN